MIRQSTVLVATPIAAAAERRNMNLAEMVGPIIQGLNDTTANLTGFTMENVAVDLPDYTKDVSEHTEVLEPVTTKLAEVMRGALYTISHYVKPICVLADEKLRCRLRSRDPIDTIFEYLNVQQVNLEPEFLNSPFCPTEASPALIEVPVVNLDLLLRGDYPAMTGDAIRDLIYLDVPELVTFFEDTEELQRVYNQVFVENNWWSVFDSKAIDENRLDTMSNENANSFGKFRPLVMCNLIINRLIGMDSPLEGVTAVSLTEYHNSLELSRSVFGAILARFRNIWVQKAAAGVVILDDRVKLERAEWGAAEGAQVMTGTVSVGYNQAALDMFANDMDTSISELVIGQLFARQRGYVYRDILTDFSVLRSAYDEYAVSISVKAETNVKAIASDAFINATKELSVSDKFESLVAALPGDCHASMKIINALNDRVEMEHAFIHAAEISRGEKSFMETGLAIQLANIFQSEIAAEIITASINATPGPIEHQRKVLRGALAKAILKRLMK